jgi:arsenite methyltransferase
MKSGSELKEIVKASYGRIAEMAPESLTGSCCGAGTTDCNMSEDYSGVAGYQTDADLSLGCGIPTEHAMIKNGDTVIDLGSGAGIDCFVARELTGENGRVIGIDMTEAMISKARKNALNLGFSNVEFRLGEIERMPVAAETADVVISNCVLNLVPDKTRAFCEINRVMKAGGRFSISDIVISGNLPEHILHAAELYAGCVAGAISKEEYLTIIAKSGFKNIKVVKERNINLPDSLLLEHMDQDALNKFRASGAAIVSITVTAEKTGNCKNDSCC